MRRAAWAIAAVGSLTLTAVFVFQLFASPYAPVTAPRGGGDVPAGRPETPALPAAPSLPVTRVVLYSSGVAYFQREGEVEGDARIDLAFPVKDVNDLLKSMVLQDLGGGTVSAASYDSHDPLERTLGSFAINLNGNPSFAELLHQARGEKVEVHLHKDAAPLVGTVIGVEPGFKELIFGGGGVWSPQGPAGIPPTPVVGAACRAPVSFSASPVRTRAYYQNSPRPAMPRNAMPGLVAEAAEDGIAALAAEPARLNLSCADGLRSVPLTDVQRVRFVNPAMEREFRRALEVLAGAHDGQKRAVSLTFRGAGKRKVRVGYVVESPLWRTSYRLLVGVGGKLFLQGWAVVENPTGEDWKDVRLALVSGRPLSFKMDLYQPLYLTRPTVQPQYYAGVQPQTHDGAAVPPPPPNSPPIPGFNSFENGRFGPPGAVPAPALPMSPAPQFGDAVAGTSSTAAPKQSNGQLNFQRSVTPAATAAELGDFFQYEIRHPVSLPRQKSAMLPIVGKEIEGSRVSLYNPAIHAKSPLLALKIKNTSGLHLMQGPVSVFEGTGYAGDAHLLDLRPGEERLLSYAVDLGTEVEPLCTHAPARLTSVRIHKGLLFRTTRVREAKTYSVRNRSGHDRTVLLEHPVRPAYRLAGKVKPVERTRAVYRFEVKVPAGKTAALEVVEERDGVEQVGLCGCDEPTLRRFLEAVNSSDAVKQAVEKALGLKAKLSATQGELTRRQGQLQEIANDQQRLRANLKEMPATAAAYKRYLEKFDRQETEIEKLQAQVRKLQEAEARQRQEYEAHWGQVEIGPTPARSGERMPLPQAAPPPPPTVRGAAPVQESSGP